MGQALYRKYRSRSFNEVVGQQHIVTTLDNAIKAGRISHAYLFTGPRGVGKTSVARILAHVINDLPYTDESTHLDIIEIDAASNRRIDEIRDLRDKVHVAPSSAKYKVYIIDEVHMLTKEAFNALLKTLEEPPAHCVFILATTELHKVPETIISRTQRFHFKPISQEHAIAHLKSLAKKEKISISDEALRLLVRHGEGSFRDSISLLDQVRSGSDTITESDVEQALGIPAEKSIAELYDHIRAGSADGLAKKLDALLVQGFSATAVASRLSAHIRALVIASKAEQDDIALLESLLRVSGSQRAPELLEVILFDFNARAIHQKSSASGIQPPPKENIQPRATSLPKSSDKTAEKETKRPAEATVTNTSTSILPMSEKDWEKILTAAEQRSSGLYRALRVAEAKMVNNVLELRFAFALHKKKVDSVENKKLLTDIIAEQGFIVPEITLIVDKDIKPQAPPPKSSLSEDTTQTISNIFGGAELLES